MNSRLARTLLFALPLLLWAVIVPAEEVTIQSGDQFDFALEALEKGDPLRAVTEFERFVRFFPGDEKVPKARLLIGVAYLRAKAYPRAREVLAEVNGIPVMKEEFLVQIEPYPDRMKESIQGRERILQSLVDQILLEGEAKRLGLDRDSEYVRKVESYRHNLLNSKLLDTLHKGGFAVTPEDARKYFDEHPEEFDRPERVQARHILVATGEEAQKVLEEIRAGLSFEKAAEKYSKDTSTRGRGGDLGTFSRKQRPELAKTAFSLSKPDQISRPVKTDRGFHLVQLVLAPQPAVLPPSTTNQLASGSERSETWRACCPKVTRWRPAATRWALFQTVEVVPGTGMSS